MRCQSVRRGVWYIGGRRKRRKQTRGLFPVGALAAPIQGKLDVVIKKLFGGKRRRSQRQYVQRQSIARKYC